MECLSYLLMFNRFQCHLSVSKFTQKIGSKINNNGKLVSIDMFTLTHRNKKEEKYNDK